MAIPRTIHYCWFGRNEKPQIVLQCIASWKKYMPDYKIVEWNEDNYDIHKSAFMEEAYGCKKWAFVSDYARFDIIHTYGGIYVDTDVEFLQPLPDTFLEQGAFTAYESAGKISPGLIYGAEAGHGLTREILEVYETMHFLQDGKTVEKTVNTVTTEVLLRHGAEGNGKQQRILDLTIYPATLFCGFDQDVMEYDIRPETISVHHYAGTWQKRSGKRMVQKWIKSLFGISFYRRLLQFKRQLCRRDAG